MQWSISWSNEAASDLSKIDNKDAKRIVEKLEEASKNPNHYFERLVGNDYYKLRIGDYRVLVVFFHTNNTIHIQKLGHRKNIYK